MWAERAGRMGGQREVSRWGGSGEGGAKEGHERVPTAAFFAGSRAPSFSGSGGRTCRGSAETPQQSTLRN